MKALAAALLAAIALALSNLASLAGAGYAGFAGRHLDRPEAPGTRAAAQIAARWQPWSSRHAALHGWVLAVGGDADPALEAYHRALRLAPGDPVLWTEYALALARLGQFDAPLTLAVTQARRLAPHSPAVRSSVADIGLAYWPRGAPDQQVLWLDAMREEVQRDRGTFLGHVLTRGQGRTFCAGPARALAEERWCDSIAVALVEGCFHLTPTEPVACSPVR